MLNNEQLIHAEKCINQRTKLGCRKCSDFKSECPAFEVDLLETTLKYKELLEKSTKSIENALNGDIDELVFILKEIKEVINS